MENHTNCRFCDIAAGKYSHAVIDEPFAFNHKFMAVASIGALVEGWSLIIPKEHQYSMKGIYGDTEFADFVNSVSRKLVSQYGDVIAFEHGANRKGSITACGTEHAHLHLVPMGASLIPDMEKTELKWNKCRASEIMDISESREYLFYSELNDKGLWQDSGYLHVLEHPQSQFFRRLIATHIGNTETFDYRQYPHLETAAKTRTALVGSSV